jgi:GNAT superfamily N-acetyltransferase
MNMQRLSTPQVPQPLQIREIACADADAWRDLFGQYLRFYRQHLPEETCRLTFERLNDPAGSGLHGLLAEQGGRLIGFVHYLFHPSTWTATPVCYLEDLFVTSAARGAGAGRALIQAVYAAADREGASAVYWMTQEFNSDARALYDTLARRTSFIRYER